MPTAIKNYVFEKVLKSGNDFLPKLCKFAALFGAVAQVVRALDS